MASIQKLYDACKLSLVNPSSPPAPLAVTKIRQLLDKINPADVGLTSEALNEQKRRAGFFDGWKTRNSKGRTSPVSYLHLHECDKFSMGIFCLPTGSAIPLHDHPGMTVFSRLLLGTLHIESYDWVHQQRNSYTSEPRLAKLVVDRVVSGPAESVILFPTTGGNIHTFTAITSCAILDILTPPYSPSDGRHCTYYRKVPLSGGDAGDKKRVHLVECQPPSDFVVESGVYNGPQLSV